MPRGFSETEQQRIRARLNEEAERLFAAHGIRRVTVSELARAAGIAKGSFYRFARSKETLFFDLLERAEAEIRREIEEELHSLGYDPQARIRAVVARAGRVIRERPIFRVLLDPEELSYVARGVPPERLQAHARGDAGYFERLFADLVSGAEVHADVATGIIKVLVLLPALEGFVGPQLFPDVQQRLGRYVAEGLAGDLL